MMIKKILFYIVAVSMLSASAVEVVSESALVTALSGADKNITITSSFTTKSDIEIPEGYVVTMADGITMTLGYKWSLFNTKYYRLYGAGTLVTGTKKIVIDKKCRLPDVLPTTGDSRLDTSCFQGAAYEVTRVITTGGTLSKSKDSQLECKISTSIFIGDERYDISSIDPKAIVCSASSGINGGRKYVGAYSSMKEAFNAAISSSIPAVTSKNIVVLLEDGEFTVDAPDNKYVQKTIVIDCAGFSGKIKQIDYMISKVGEFGSSSFVTFLNAKSAAAPKLTNSNAAFINCEEASVAEINNTCTTHIYDCGSVSVGTYASGGAYFYCGGPYSVTFKDKYWAYGGTYNSEPTPASGYETVHENGVWTVRKYESLEKVVYIGETGYPTLQDAVNASANGDEIILKTELSLKEPVTISSEKNVTINLAGLNVNADNGAFINNGVLKLEDASGSDSQSSVSTTAGNLIENNGDLEITYGVYNGSIIQTSGSLTVHNGTFNGELLVAESAGAGGAVRLFGGAFKKTVASFLIDGYIEKSYLGYNYVGKFPRAIVADTTVSGVDKAWTVECLSSSDYALYVNNSGKKTDYANPSDWYRRAEIKSMIDPYKEMIVDIVVKFDRPVKGGSVSAKAGNLTPSALNQDLEAGEEYRILSSNIADGYSQKSLRVFLAEYSSGAIAGIKNNSVAENSGTLCTIEMQLCREVADDVLEKVYVLASASYRFPWKDTVPELREDDTPETVASALEGTVDARVAENIKDVASYNSYRQWTAGVKGATAADVKAAPNAWLSYALNTTNLVETPLEGDMSVASISPAAEDGVFKLSIAVKDIDIGAGNVSDEQMQENLAKVFGIEGSTSLDSNSFSRDNVVYTLGAPADGKVTVEARPAVASPTGCFFMRAKMTP